MMDQALGRKIIELKDRIVAGFDAHHWSELGMLTGASDIIDGHRRLLRSLSFGDEDYASNVLDVLREISMRDMRALSVVERYLDDRFPGESTFISAKPASRKITFAPDVFRVPEGGVELDLVAVMMPFKAEFKPVFEAVQSSCSAANLRCLRAASSRSTPWAFMR